MEKKKKKKLGCQVARWCVFLFLRAFAARICRTKAVEHSLPELFPVALPPTTAEVQVRVAEV